MKITAIHHKPFFHEGTIEEALREAGADITYFKAWEDDLDRIDPLDKNPVVFFGGPMGVYQADLFPFLVKEIKILETRLKHDLPTMGVCLGAQMMAKALGSEVYKGKQGPEIGWHEIKINKAGQETAARHLDASKTKMIQWHGDTFDFPEGATLLASSDQYKNQMYSYGKNAIAMQCHPEVNEKILEYWILIGGFHDLAKTGQTLPEFRKQTEKYMGTLKTQTKLFVHEWLETILGQKEDAA